MRRTLACKAESRPWQSSCIFDRQPPSRQFTFVSGCSDPHLYLTSQPRPHGQLKRLRGEPRRSVRCLASQSDGLQISTKLQALTKWLIDNGVEGLHGDTQRAEIYQDGENNSGLRATTVLIISLQPTLKAYSQDCLPVYLHSLVPAPCWYSSHIVTGDNAVLDMQL